MSKKHNSNVPAPEPGPGPFEQLEIDRLAALKSYNVLDTPPEDVFDDIVKVASTALSAPIALLTLVDADRQWFKAKTGVDIGETDRSISFCAHTVSLNTFFSIPDLTADQRFRNNPFVVNDPNLRFYAGCPITTPEGYSIGAVCVLDTRPRSVETSEIELLTRLSGLAMTQLGIRRDGYQRMQFAEELRDAHEELIQAAIQLETRFAQRTQALRVSENRFRTVVEGLEEAILIINFKRIVQYANVRITDLTGYAPEEIVGKAPCAQFLKEANIIDSRLQLALVQRRISDVWEACIKRKDGSEFWAEIKTKPYVDENGKSAGMLCSILDISERKRYQEELTHQAFSDTLTKLPNRVLFLNRLDKSLEADRRLRHLTGLLFIDLDNFKIINDSLGHAVGDELLIAVSARLQLLMRPQDTLARLGGDEFVILLDGLHTSVEAAGVAERVSQCLQEAITLRGREVYTTASIGVALSDGTRIDADGLLRQADIAMYRAKSLGKGSYFVFDNSMNEEARERLELETELRLAIANNELRLHYQPIIDMSTGEVVQIEALVRWDHPVRGLLGPNKFITLAEESGLIVPLGLWVLENACFEMTRIDKLLLHHTPLVICVNLSTRQFYQANMVEEIGQVLRSTGLPARRLKLEITESLMMDSADSIEKLNRLKALGVSLAVDDFGTGYSSMSYLGKFPIDALKIDQSFIAHIGRTSDARAIIEAMIMVGKALGMRVTCEGIETALQHEHLKNLACDFGQGYHYSRPVAATELVRRIEQIESRPDLCRSLSVAA
jgi:diguanylate cyclase (GGDEF)-like protein/PAS domain S-box-containing protein